MSFPNTSLTLIHRLRRAGDEADWQQFLNDYWGPICQFAARRGSLTREEAEDIASDTIEALLRGQLLERWEANRAAKLRTLLCAVVTNLISNRARVQSAREQRFREFAEELAKRSGDPGQGGSDRESEDIFYSAWANALLRRTVGHVRTGLYAEGKGDYFRVLHGRLCEAMSMADISESLGISLASVDNYFRAAKRRLTAALEEAVREHVSRYCKSAELEAEFRSEWNAIGDFLKQHGGLEQVVREQSNQSIPNAPNEKTRILVRNAGLRKRGGPG